MKAKIIFAAIALGSCVMSPAKDVNVSSPNQKLVVSINDNGGKASYSINYEGKTFLNSSRLGIVADAGNFAENLSIAGSTTAKIDEKYSLSRSKTANAHYVANQLKLELKNAKGQTMFVTFNVSDNDVAFRYSFPVLGGWNAMHVDSETTSFNIPSSSTAFIAPQSDPCSAWCRTHPAYEEVYSLDAPLDKKSQYGYGYTFPALFRVGNDGWMLISETGTDGGYAGCALSEYKNGEGYTVAFPSHGQNAGLGSDGCGLSLPASTPWRTITVGSTLKPIVETTIPFDVVKAKYPASQNYAPGRYVWSWIIWQDESINYDDQKAFIDMAAQMGYEYSLIDANWDVEKNIGRKRMAELSKYAASKGVRLILWYNSNGSWNDAPQTPRNLMNTVLQRRKEMKWLKETGIAGIKVDFFGGDKQETMQLYEDILSDANDFGIFVIFHGCTLPRGWERMYPNFIASEAVRASENVYFNEESAKSEAQELATFAFTRNAVAAMDYGGTMLNKYFSRDNKSRHARHTSDILEIAAAYITQSDVQCVGIMPNNLNELPQFELDMLKEIPAAWDETQFIDGYPGKYFIVAHRKGNDWYVAGLNAGDKELKLTLKLPMFAGKQVTYYNDRPAKGGALPQGQMQKLKVNTKGEAKVVIQPQGGLLLQ